MRMWVSGGLMRTRAEERVRLFLGLVEVQTGQSQPITGTPCEVPVPRNSSSVGDGWAHCELWLVVFTSSLVFPRGDPHAPVSQSSSSHHVQWCVFEGILNFFLCFVAVSERGAEALVAEGFFDQDDVFVLVVEVGGKQVAEAVT
jgi:hypothetical protein